MYIVKIYMLGFYVPSREGKEKMKNLKMILTGLVLVLGMSLVGCTDSTNITGRDISVPKSEEQSNKEKEATKKSFDNE